MVHRDLGQNLLHGHMGLYLPRRDPHRRIAAGGRGRILAAGTQTKAEDQCQNQRKLFHSKHSPFRFCPDYTPVRPVCPHTFAEKRVGKPLFLRFLTELKKREAIASLFPRISYISRFLSAGRQYLLSDRSFSQRKIQRSFAAPPAFAAANNVAIRAQSIPVVISIGKARPPSCRRSNESVS